MEVILFIITAALCQATKHIPGALNEAVNNLRGKIIIILCECNFTFFCYRGNYVNCPAVTVNRTIYF